MYFQICHKICEERNNLNTLFCWFVIDFQFNGGGKKEKKLKNIGLSLYAILFGKR